MVLAVLKRVFGQTRYSMLAFSIMFLVLSAFLLLPNLDLIIQVFAAENVTFYTKIIFLIGIYGSLFTNFNLLSAANLIVIAILFGMNISLLVYYIRRRQTTSRNVKIHLTSFGGLVSGLLGIGCAACGSIILTALLGMFGASGFLILLPFHGAEFGFIGVMILLLSTRYLLNHINDPLLCENDLS